MSQSTVVERKQAFLRQQKQILAKGITPSRRLLEIADEGSIQTKVLGDVMLKVNRDLKRHAREVHSRQMTDHVVEQIDLLYWEAGAPALETEPDVTAEAGADDSGILYQGEDLMLDKNILKLPTRWDTSTDPPSSSLDDEGEVDPDTYIEAVSRLQDLSAQRLTLQQKLNTYRTLLSLLEPYRKPQRNVQPNLVTRDAPIASELNKTRTLAIRVAGRIGENHVESQDPTMEEEADEEMVESDGKAKLDRVLSGW